MLYVLGQVNKVTADLFISLGVFFTYLNGKLFYRSWGLVRLSVTSLLYRTPSRKVYNLSESVLQSTTTTSETSVEVDTTLDLTQ